MSSAELLGDAFGRINSLVHHGVDGLTLEQLTFTPDPDANSISWLIWHLTRIEDDHIAGVADIEQVWLSSQWRVRFDLPFEPTATGYGHGASEVAAVVVDAERLVGYQDAVYEQTRRFVGGLQESDLPRIVDQNFDPPVTLGVRLVSVVSDCLQHAGQAAYVRGLATRR